MVILLVIISRKNQISHCPIPLSPGSATIGQSSLKFMRYRRHKTLILVVLQLAIILVWGPKGGVDASRLPLGYKEIHEALASADSPFIIDTEACPYQKSHLLWRGKTKHNNYPVAIKTFPKTAKGQSLDRQASILASLDHPNIIRYISSIKSDSDAHHHHHHDNHYDYHHHHHYYGFLVTEWAAGRTLQSMVPIKDISKLAVIIAQIMSATHYLHSKKIALGELKAEDIIISDSLAVSLVNLSHAKRNAPSLPLFNMNSFAAAAGCLLDDYKLMARLIYYAYLGKHSQGANPLMVDNGQVNELLAALTTTSRGGEDPQQLWHNCYERFAGFARFSLFKDVAALLPSLFQYRPFYDVDPKKVVPHFREQASSIHMQELEIISWGTPPFSIGKYRDQPCIIHWMPTRREYDKTRLIRSVNFLVAFGGMDPVPELLGIVTDEFNQSSGIVMKVPAGEFYSSLATHLSGVCAMGSIILKGLNQLHRNSIAYLSLYPQSIWITAEGDQNGYQAIFLDYSLVETDASPTFGIRTPIIESDDRRAFIEDVARFGTQPYYSYGMAVDYYALSAMLPGAAHSRTDLISILADPDHGERWKYCYTDYETLQDHPYFKSCGDTINLTIH